MLGKFSPESLRAFAEVLNLNTGNQDFSEGVFDFKICETPKGERYGIPNLSNCAAPNKPVAAKTGKDFFGKPTKENIDESFRRTVPSQFDDPIIVALRRFSQSTPYEVGADAKDLYEIVKKYSKGTLTQGQARVLNQVYKDIDLAFTKSTSDEIGEVIKIPLQRLKDAKMTAILVERKPTDRDPGKAMERFLDELKADAPAQAARRKREKLAELGYSEKTKPGLYANIHAKRKRIKAGSGEKMAGKNDPNRPTAGDFKAAAKTAKQ